VISLFIPKSANNNDSARRDLQDQIRAKFARKSVSATTHDSKIEVVKHPLVSASLAILRAKTTTSADFRRALQEISVLLLGRASAGWETVPHQVETPLQSCMAEILARPLVLVPILRAGLGMLDGMLALLPRAAIGHIGVYRDEKTLLPSTYFCRLPGTISEAQVVLVDPMLATGNSACQAISLLKKSRATRIQFICLVACPPGIKRLHSEHPDVPIVTAAIDPELNEFGYIVPGLGDAGDRYFGTE
jgi:uracil phosphoribosyltransferase